jgi:hypothetical protein
MHSSAILREARQLRNVSERLDSLAEQHPLISEGLITISRNVRHTAMLLEVLLRRKWGCRRNQIQRTLDLRIFCRDGSNMTSI